MATCPAEGVDEVGDDSPGKSSGSAKPTGGAAGELVDGLGDVPVNGLGDVPADVPPAKPLKLAGGWTLLRLLEVGGVRA